MVTLIDVTKRVKWPAVYTGSSKLWPCITLV